MRRIALINWEAKSLSASDTNPAKFKKCCICITMFTIRRLSAVVCTPSTVAQRRTDTFCSSADMNTFCSSAPETLRSSVETFQSSADTAVVAPHYETLCSSAETFRSSVECTNGLPYINVFVRCASAHASILHAFYVTKSRTDVPVCTPLFKKTIIKSIC